MCFFCMISSSSLSRKSFSQSLYQRRSQSQINGLSEENTTDRTLEFPCGNFCKKKKKGRWTESTETSFRRTKTVRRRSLISRGNIYFGSFIHIYIYVFYPFERLICWNCIQNSEFWRF